MTASKSSRARNARAQAAARSGTAAAGRASRGGTATRPAGPAVRQPTVAKGGTATKTGPAVRTGANGTTRTNVQAKAPAVSTPAIPGGLLAKVKARLASVMSPGESAVPLWLRLTTFLVALAGLGVSIYLTIAHFTESTLAGCNETGGLVNCTKVTTSPQSYVFGIPVAVLGLAFYLFMVAIMSPWAWRATRREVHLVRIAALIAGVGFVLYLLYAELFIIGSICLYCTSVHVLTFILFVLTVFAAATWGVGRARSAS
ncbi:MAG: vitamin K epoxide reductase family protein [Streptosporangiaceae bacterium]